MPGTPTVPVANVGTVLVTGDGDERETPVGDVPATRGGGGPATRPGWVPSEIESDLRFPYLAIGGGGCPKAIDDGPSGNLRNHTCNRGAAAVPRGRRKQDWTLGLVSGKVAPDYEPHGPMSPLVDESPCGSVGLPRLPEGIRGHCSVYGDSGGPPCPSTDRSLRAGLDLRQQLGQ